MADKGELQIRVRRLAGQKLVHEHLKGLALTLHRPVDETQLIELAKSDEVLASFQEVWSRVQQHPDLSITSFSTTEPQVMNELLENLKARIPDQRMYLFRSVSHYCGAVVVQSHEVIEHALDLIELDQEDVLAANESGSFGIVLEYVTEQSSTEDRVPTLKLLAWNLQ